jgi:hypothetical protein
MTKNKLDYGSIIAENVGKQYAMDVQPRKVLYHIRATKFLFESVKSVI